MTVVYQWQCWKEMIVQEKKVKQECERFLKQYLIKWKKFWVYSVFLSASELLQNWRTMKISLKHKCRIIKVLFSDYCFFKNNNSSNVMFCISWVMILCYVDLYEKHAFSDWKQMHRNRALLVDKRVVFFSLDIKKRTVL